MKRKSIVIGLLAISSMAAGGQYASAETLQEALIAAYNSHPQLLAERARVRETDETYIQARAQGRLTTTLGVNAGPAYGQTSAFAGTGGGNITNEGFPYSASLQVIQPLYQGGRVRALKRQAKAGVLAARETLLNVEQTVFTTVATAYIDVLRDEETARIRRNNVRVLTRQRAAAQDRFDVGEGTRTDIAQADSRLAGAEIGLANADAQLQISRANYVRAVGYAPAELQTVPVFVLPDSLETAMRLARENNPQLTAAYLSEEAAEAAIDVAKAALRPTVSLNGTVQGAREQISGITESESAALTAQLLAPIFSGGLNRSQVRSAKHARTRTGFEVRDAERFVDQTVSQLWAQLDSAKRTLVASRAQVEAAEIAFEGVELEQQVGTRNTLDVLDAEQEVLNAKLSVVDAERGVNAITFQILNAVGAFNAESLRLPVDLYDPSQNFNAVKEGGLLGVFDKFKPKVFGAGTSDFDASTPDDVPVIYTVPTAGE